MLDDINDIYIMVKCMSVCTVLLIFLKTFFFSFSQIFLFDLFSIFFVIFFSSIYFSKKF